MYVDMHTGMDFTSFQLDPVAFYIGEFEVRWYALAYLAGFLIGWKYCLKLAGRFPDARPNKDDIDDFLNWAVLAVILGGRIGYVLFYQLDYYLSHPMEIHQVWKGGMSFHGGFFGVLVALILYSKKHDIPLFKLSDMVCAAAPIGLFFGRIANFINGELYGTPTKLPWAVAFPNGGISLRHPSQIYEALLEGVVLFLILRVLVKSEKVNAGVVSGVFLIGYGLFRALVEFVREPDPQLGLLWGFISMGQILCIPMIIAGAGVVWWAQWKNNVKSS